MINQSIYTLQDNEHTSLMLQVGDDPPVCVFRYSRELARGAKSLTGLEINNVGAVDGADYTGFLMQVEADANFPLTGAVGAFNGGES